MISLVMATDGKNPVLDTNINLQFMNFLKRNDTELVISSDGKNLSEKYNNGVKKASGDKIILIHNDMAFPKNFIEIMEKSITSGRITSYFRIEPTQPPFDGKGVLYYNCGKHPVSFDERQYQDALAFFEYKIPAPCEGGDKLFFGCMKKDWIGLDSKTYTLFCEDDDIHRRYNLLGFEKIITNTFVYHFGSLTSRSLENYKNIEKESFRKFLTKWGTTKHDILTYYSKSMVFSVDDISILSDVHYIFSKIYVNSKIFKKIYLDTKLYNSMKHKLVVSESVDYTVDDIYYIKNNDSYSNVFYNLNETSRDIVSDVGFCKKIKLKNGDEIVVNRLKNKFDEDENFKKSIIYV